MCVSVSEYGECKYVCMVCVYVCVHVYVRSVWTYGVRGRVYVCVHVVCGRASEGVSCMQCALVCANGLRV